MLKYALFDLMYTYYVSCERNLYKTSILIVQDETAFNSIKRISLMSDTLSQDNRIFIPV